MPSITVQVNKYIIYTICVIVLWVHAYCYATFDMPHIKECSAGLRCFTVLIKVCINFSITTLHPVVAHVHVCSNIYPLVRGGNSNYMYRDSLLPSGIVYNINMFNSKKL